MAGWPDYIQNTLLCYTWAGIFVNISTVGGKQKIASVTGTAKKKICKFVSYSMVWPTWLRSSKVSISAK